MTPKIIELIIEDGDEQAGLDGIALVELPAHEAKFEYFNQDEEPTKYVLNEEQIEPALKMFASYGEPQGLLESEGWKIISVEKMDKMKFATISSEPNKDSFIFDTPTQRVRFKYVGPQDEKNRQFCGDMMSLRRVFRVEDIDAMSRENINPVGPTGYDVFEWRGSYNCRHGWVKLVYAKEGVIINNDKVKKGVLYEEGVPGPDTRTDATIAAGNTEPRDFFSKTKMEVNVSGLAPYVDQVTDDVEKKPVLASLPMFENREDAEAMAEAIGCKGSHSMGYGDKILWMPCETHELEGNEGHPDMYSLEDACWEGYEPIGLKPDGSPNCVPVDEEMSADGEYVVNEFESYTDYPELVRKNAQSALDYIEKSGNPKGCMTQVGKVRAQQLAQGKPISIETVKRMKSYISRHKVDLQSSKSYEDGCGKLAMDAWGGVEALPWVERTISQYENMSTFSVFNAEQRIVVGPAMIPDKMIIRRNEITGEIYYVYFTAETIKKLQQKFMQEKLLDKTNIEHGRKFLQDVDVVESWIVEDATYDKQKVYNMEYPKGTWMIVMKINEPEVWNKVKDGKLKGFSVQGYFLEKAKFGSQSVLDEIKTILKDVKI
jgi:hypothetical protein